jgi:hypothetical protein
MPRQLISLAWLGVFAALAGFFLPWALLDVREGTVVKQLGAGARRGLRRVFKSVD